MGFSKKKLQLRLFIVARYTVLMVSETWLSLQPPGVPKNQRHPNPSLNTFPIVRMCELMTASEVALADQYTNPDVKCL